MKETKNETQKGTRKGNPKRKPKKEAQEVSQKKTWCETCVFVRVLLEKKLKTLCQMMIDYVKRNNRQNQQN